MSGGGDEDRLKVRTRERTGRGFAGGLTWVAVRLRETLGLFGVFVLIISIPAILALRLQTVAR